MIAPTARCFPLPPPPPPTQKGRQRKCSAEVGEERGGETIYPVSHLPFFYIDLMWHGVKKSFHAVHTVYYSQKCTLTHSTLAAGRITM